MLKIFMITVLTSTSFHYSPSTLVNAISDFYQERENDFLAHIN
jgi:hypothetical protein